MNKKNFVAPNKPEKSRVSVKIHNKKDEAEILAIIKGGEYNYRNVSERLSLEQLTELLRKVDYLPFHSAAISSDNCHSKILVEVRAAKILLRTIFFYLTVPNESTASRKDLYEMIEVMVKGMNNCESDEAISHSLCKVLIRQYNLRGETPTPKAD